MNLPIVCYLTNKLLSDRKRLLWNLAIALRKSNFYFEIASSNKIRLENYNGLRKTNELMTLELEPFYMLSIDSSIFMQTGIWIMQQRSEIITKYFHDCALI